VNQRRHVFVFVCGILTQPGASANWTGRAVTWTHTRMRDRCAEKVEYFTSALMRPFGQRDRAERLAKVVGAYLANDWRVTIAAHSNGADVALDALDELGFPELDGLHLISAACSADARKSGLNQVRARVVSVWIGGRDWALQLAATVPGLFLGYGQLGRKGPENLTRPCEIIHEPRFGHSDWFHAEAFDDTMRRVHAL
jgi:hypothetical protein